MFNRFMAGIVLLIQVFIRQLVYAMATGDTWHYVECSITLMGLVSTSDNHLIMTI